MSFGRKIVKNTLALGISNFIPRIIQTILILYATKKIGDVGIGKYYTLSSIVAILNLVTDFGLNSLLTREVSKDSNKATIYFWNVFWFKFFLSFFAFALLIIVVKILGYSTDIVNGAYVFGIYMILSTLIGLVQAFWQAFEEMHFIGSLSVVVAVFNLGIASWLLVRDGNFMALIWGLLLSSLVGVGLNFGFITKRISFAFKGIDLAFLKQMVKMSIPFALISIFSTIYFRIDTIFLSKFQSEAVVGWYGSAHKIIEVLQMIPYAFLGAAYPAFSRTFVTDFEKFTLLYKQMFKVLIYLGFPVTFGLAFLSNPILKYFGKEFGGATFSLQILSVALLLMFANSQFMTICMAIDKIKFASLVSMGDVVLSIFLNLLFIPKWGLNLSLNGASFTAVICETFNFIVLGIYLSKKIFPLDIVKISIRPLLASLIMLGTVYLARGFGLWLSVAVGAVIYSLMIVLFRGITQDEIIFLKKALIKA